MAETVDLKTRSPFSFNIDADKKGFKKSIKNHLKYTFARDPQTATKRDWWLSVCYSLRDRILERFINTQYEQHTQDVRRVYYFSLEYLMGRLLTNNLYNSGMFDIAREAIEELGMEYEEIREEEVDMGLGNGGLGRLAACFLDSLATMDYAAIGYGIHYEFGLFRQEFVNGKQEERPDNWLRFGNPWQIVRPENYQVVRLYGHMESAFDDKGDWHPVWKGTKTLHGVPWDVPVVGYSGSTVNFLRLWESKASEEFDLHIFNEGGYVKAVQEKVAGETVSKVLYPNDKTEIGKELRLVQQYFFVSCSLQDIIRRHKQGKNNWDTFADKVAIQLNDTHPAIAVPELMRLLVDEGRLHWDRAWSICQKVFGYTNHTLMPEALERWSVPLFEKVLPRHLQIIFEINRRFLENEVEAKWPGDNDKKRDMSIIEEGNPKMIRMAYLAVVASHSINGVAELHTQLIKKNLFCNFYALYPHRFNNKTNGVTPRRWLKVCNPRLASLLDETIGTEWITHLELLRKLEPFADQHEFQDKFMAVKRANKAFLSQMIQKLCGTQVDPDALFDVQVKRLHEYKRQHLNLLHILTLYRRLLHDPNYDMHPRVFIFGAKAAPGYELAKNIIHAINVAAGMINNDTRIQNKLKVAFLPNYGVTLASKIIPAADLSEQISTAGTEASGTGNMKLALNGACTIGTLDGANVEIREEVGNDNIFIFGKTVDEIHALKTNGYNPYDYYNALPELKMLLDWMSSGFFKGEESQAMRCLRHSLLDGGDPFFVLADYEAYCHAQGRVDAAYRNRRKWAQMAILNTARMGKFSSDRTICEYAKDIWNITPLDTTSTDCC
ncbi:MAG: glycogen phosphorylase [Verrucomicrobia bacterium GWF2_51_19]|nr:MAG: glycogen phosphorylase [Verrucomicrobia bacterium GWF2_51_19]HCJ11526.1 glycogen phosphorylase [Opitutae bacterium]